MHELSSRDTWKHPGRDGYISQDYDDMYLEMLRAEQVDVKDGDESDLLSKTKIAPIKIIGIILTTPYACLRASMRTFFKKITKHPHP